MLLIIDYWTLSNIHYLLSLLKIILMKKDNICALATASGMGAISIVRVSGPDAIAICSQLFKSVKKGIYAPNFGGGQVDITSGKFVFSSSLAWLIEDGKVTQPIKGASIVGNGPDILKKVSMVGNDSSLDTGVGTCGKDGQSVPVGVGQPTLKIDEILVGGSDTQG